VVVVVVVVVVRHKACIFISRAWGWAAPGLGGGKNNDASCDGRAGGDMRIKWHRKLHAG